MKTITKQLLERLIQQEGNRIHNQFLRQGTFWPKQICRLEARKKLMTQYKISK